MKSAGMLDKLIKLRLWSDVPNAAFGLDQTFDAGIDCWANRRPSGQAAYWGAKQVGEEVTDRFTVRRDTGTHPEQITGLHVVELDGFRFRVVRAFDLDGATEFTAIDCKLLGAVS